MGDLSYYKLTGLLDPRYFSKRNPPSLYYTTGRREYQPTFWEPGMWVEAKDQTGELRACGPSAVHGYTPIPVAALMNRIHGNYNPPILWRCEFDGPVAGDGLKVWGRRQRIIGEPLALPAVTLTQRIRFWVLIELALHSCSLDVETINSRSRWLAELAGPNGTGSLSLEELPWPKDRKFSVLDLMHSISSSIEWRWFYDRSGRTNRDDWLRLSGEYHRLAELALSC